MKQRSFFPLVVSLILISLSCDNTTVYKPILVPSTFTDSAVVLSANTAILCGSVHPNGTSTKYYFEYGTTDSYETKLGEHDGGNATSVLHVSDTVNTFRAGTLYHYRLVAFSDGGVVKGLDKMFVTMQVPQPPGKYFLGGLVSYKQTGYPVFGGVVLKLDDSASYTLSYSGACNYGFSNVSAGLHRIRITSPSTLPVDTNIVVDHDANCTAGSSTYNFQIVIGLTNQGRELVISRGIGTTWKFEFRSSSSTPQTASYSNSYGIHTWQLASVDAQATTTTLHIVDVRNDSTHIKTPLTDSTFTLRDTLYFPIIISSDSIAINCPEVDAFFRTIPRYCLQSADTVSLTYPNPYESSSAKYANQIGITEYSSSRGGNNSYTRSLKLTEFTKR